MEIIMLLGKSRCGKTSTIHKVYEILTKDTPNVIFQEDDGDDFSAILAYKGKKIAFHSLGDFARQVIDAMYEYCDKGCDVLICAGNETFVTPPRKAKIFSSLPPIIKEKNLDATQFDANNTLYANKIITLLNSIIQQ